MTGSAKRPKFTEGVLSNKKKRVGMSSQTPSHAKPNNRPIAAGVALSATYQPRASALASLSQGQPKSRRKFVSTNYGAGKKAATSAADGAVKHGKKASQSSIPDQIHVKADTPSQPAAHGSPVV